MKIRRKWRFPVRLALELEKVNELIRPDGQLGGGETIVISQEMTGCPVRNCRAEKRIAETEMDSPRNRFSSV